MKIVPLALFSLFLVAGCSSEEDTPGGGSQALVMKYPEPLAGIIAQAVDADELDDTQPKDDYVFRTQYMPNERTPKSGWIKRIFEGKVTLLAEVKDGALNGRSIVFEQGGAKWKEFTLKNGNYEGTYTEFQADGSKKFECSYVDGKENGSWKHWHNNSLLAEERVYQDGQASGPFALYHTNGNKAMEGAYQAGERHGPFTKWHSNKIKEAEGTYKEGKLDGPFREWWDNGRQRKEANYKEGKLDGPYVGWFNIKQKMQEGVYEDGIKVGEWVSYWKKGRGAVKDRKTYRNGEVVNIVVPDQDSSPTPGTRKRDVSPSIELGHQ